MTLNQLPGCYANLPLAQGESLPGYLLRLAEANGYSGIRDLLSALPERCTRPVGMEIRSLRADRTRLENLGRMAVGDDKHCLRFLGQAAGEHAAIVQGTRIDHDAWLEPAAQLCPLCLEEHTVIPEEWDLACVTACERHRVRLLDACTVCGEPITWGRSSLTRCPACCADYRGQPVQPAKEDVVTVSGDLASMARFRYKTHSPDALIGPWGMGFELFKFLSLSASHWATDIFPSAHIQRLSIESRVAVTERLSIARVNGCYVLPKVAPQIQELLLPLQAFPRPFVLERFALSYVTSHGSLSPEIAEALVSVVPLPKPVPGYQLFTGRPPSLHGPEAAMRFLGVDNLTFASLLHWGIISKTPSNEPFDIDELLAAQRFLNEELVTLAEQQTITGVPLQDEAGPHELVMTPWNRRNQADKRILLRTVVAVHLQLISRWNRSVELKDQISLKDVAIKTGHPMGVVGRGINLILSGSIANFNWLTPYRWGDVLVERKETDLILQGAKLQ